MVMQTRTKFSQQLDGIQDLVIRLKEKCVADVRAAGLAATPAAPQDCARLPPWVRKTAR